MIASFLISKRFFFFFFSFSFSLYSYPDFLDQRFYKFFYGSCVCGRRWELAIRSGVAQVAIWWFIFPVHLVFTPYRVWDAVMHALREWPAGVETSSVSRTKKKEKIKKNLSTESMYNFSSSESREEKRRGCLSDVSSAFIIGKNVGIRFTRWAFFIILFIHLDLFVWLFFVISSLPIWD